MEIIIIVALLALAGWWIFYRNTEVSREESAPYKVETPPSPETAVQVEKVEEPTPAPVEVVAESAPVKKARKPRTPKAETTSKEKPAKTKKPAAIAAKKAVRKPKAK